MTRGPLSDLRVLEFDDGLGQFAGKLLADLGADVVKVEPLTGSPARHVGPFAGDVPGVDRSLTFWHLNTNKRSICVDVATPEGREVVLDLVRTHDVVVDATQDGLDARGLDRDVLRAANPRLIHQRVTAFGSRGPWAGHKASDGVLLALGGLTAMNGYDGHLGLPPIAPTGGQAANLTSMYAAIAILGAVLHRDSTGRGQDAEVAAHDVIAVSTELSIPYWEHKKARVYRQTARHARPDPDTPHQVARCKDGKYVAALSLYLFDAVRFPAMVSWMDSVGMAEDLTGPEYADASYRHDRVPHINAVVHRFCAAHDSDWLFHEAQRRRLPWAPLNAPGDLIADPHLVERGAIASLPDPITGRELKYPGRPYALSQTPWSLRRRAPGLGEHTHEVLTELGRSASDLERLHESRAITGSAA